MKFYLSSIFFIGTFGTVIDFDKSLPALIDSGKSVLVSFYAPWCGHCQQLAPTWKKIGQRLASSKILVGKLDCTQHQDLASKYQIRGFPTIKIFRGGRGIDYEGARDEGVIVDWAMKATGPAVTGTKKTKNELINKYKTNPAFIYNGNIKADTDLWKKYQLIAEIHVPLVPFLRNKTTEETETISVVKDGEIYDFTGSIGTLPNWVKHEKVSNFPSFNMKIAKQLAKENVFVAVIIDRDNTQEAAIKIVREMALDRNHPVEEVSFSFATGQMSLRTIDHLTYRDSDSGDFVILPKGEQSGQYYLMTMTPEVTKEDLLQFIANVKAGKVEINGKSAMGRMFSDFIGGFVRLFQENPILGGLIIGLPTILISFIIWGICSVPEGNFNDEYEDSESGSEGDISSNEEEPTAEMDANLPDGVRKRLPREKNSSDEN